jgi:glucokinase
MSSSGAVLGIDLGGTQIKGLALAPDGSVLAELTRPTGDHGDGQWLQNVRLVSDALRQRCPDVASAGVCAPGLAARDERSIVNMPGRLQGLEGLRWTDALGLPAVVLNDAHAALLGEVWRGAARGHENVLMLTLGTGVGGAAMVDGRLLRGHLGRAGHMGHISLNPDGAPDIVGTPGSLEDAIGDCTVATRSGGRFTTTRALVQAVEGGDSAAREVWLRSIRALAAGLVSLINVLDPRIILIGGGLAEAGDALFGPLRKQLATMEWRLGDAHVEIVSAQLGPRAGALGAAWRALQIFNPS